MMVYSMPNVKNKAQLRNCHCQWALGGSLWIASIFRQSACIVKEDGIRDTTGAQICKTVANVIDASSKQEVDLATALSFVVIFPVCEDAAAGDCSYDASNLPALVSRTVRRSLYTLINCTCPLVTSVMEDLFSWGQSLGPVLCVF